MFSAYIDSTVYAALQVCHPHPGALPDWIKKSRAPARCAMDRRLVAAARTPEEAEQLADLVAHAWWECIQDGDPNPFSKPLAAACERYLTGAPADARASSATHRTTYD
ncbi:hypothetical protein [Streptomyces rubiginosohelvolus]|uniref:DUF982 domain-containing protein n=1 Tax=Streptomyces rubiginosohelvolus TaxID=67362 RepID=A0ABQ3CBJ6_9ACTN|nr:hypothetical protein [Streptomyces pluricolorescens]GGZ83723.1 hypothetical protein GCM10010328_67420 [Streptomyces pluricolorescens]